MKEFYKYAASAVLGIIIGVLLVLVIQKKDVSVEVPMPKENLSMGPVPPDTVYIDTLRIKIPYPVAKDDKPDKEEWGVGESLDVLVLEDRSDKVITVIEEYRHTSYKRFQLSPWVRSDIWAYAGCPVDSFKNDVEVRFNDYYQENVLPVWEKKLSNSKTRNIFKGIVAGSIMAFGLATNEWYYAVPAIAIGGGIIIYF